MKIEDLEIPRPYTDWEKLKKFIEDKTYDDDQNLIREYYAVTGRTEKQAASTQEQELNIPQLKDTEFLTFTEARRLATLAFAQKMTNSRGVNVEEVAGIPKFLTSKYVSASKKYAAALSSPALPVKKLENGEKRIDIPTLEFCSNVDRPLTVPLKLIPGLCRYVMKSSAHNTFFGEEGEITLPTNLGYMAKELEKFEPHELENLIQYGKTLRDRGMERYNEIDENNAKQSAFGQYRSLTEILKERLYEFGTTRQTIYEAKHLFVKNPNGPIDLQLAIKAIFAGKLANNANAEQAGSSNKYYEPRIEMLMFFAFKSGQALDYFVCNDYIYIEGGASPKGTPVNRIPIYYELEKNNKHKVTNPDILRILSFCIALPEPDKTTYLAKVYSKIV